MGTLGDGFVTQKDFAESIAKERGLTDQKIKGLDKVMNGAMVQYVDIIVGAKVEELQKAAERVVIHKSEPFTKMQMFIMFIVPIAGTVVGALIGEAVNRKSRE